MLRRNLRSVFVALVAFGLMPIAFARPNGPAAGSAAVSSAEYYLTHSVPLGTPDRWDYVVYDSPSHRVYVAHGDRITVVDGRTGRIIGQVMRMPGGTHGIAISHAAGLGYTDDGRAGEAVAFSLKTLKVVKRLKAAPDSDAVTIDPTSGHVFVVDGDAGELTVIDPMRDRVVATVHVGSKLEYAVAGDNGKIYVNGVGKREIFRVDTASNQVDATWPIPQCLAPHGLAIDTVNHRLFSSCENQRMVVVNADNGAVMATLPIGRGTDGAAFDPTRKLAFSSNGRDGNVTAIREVDANTFVVAGTIPTTLSARTMSVDPQSGRLFLAAAKTNARAMAAFMAARKAHRHGPSPFVAGSLKLLFFDPVP
jgi:DNA-binding beta-propeller fold protein YncE